MRGRRPQPTALKRLRGNPGKRRLSDREPQPRIVAMAPPPDLSTEARAEWNRVAPMLYRLGVLTEADGSALVAYCRLWDRWLRAERDIQKTGLLLRSTSRDGMPKVNPLVRVSEKTMAQLIRLLGEFGMTPASRTRVRREGSGASDPDEDFLDG